MPCASTWSPKANAQKSRSKWPLRTAVSRGNEPPPKTTSRPVAAFQPVADSFLRHRQRQFRPTCRHEGNSVATGQVVPQLKGPFRDGITHIVMRPRSHATPGRAGAAPGLHLIRFLGVRYDYCIAQSIAILTTTIDTKRPGLIRRAWRGQANPWAPLLGLMVPTGLIGISASTQIGLLMAIGVMVILPWPAAIALVVLYFLLGVAGTVMTWRCAGNLSSSGRKAAFRLGTFVLLIAAFAPVMLATTKIWGFSRDVDAQHDRVCAALDNDGRLLFAARLGDAERVARLLASGANVHAQETKSSETGYTPLHYAAAGYSGGAGKQEEVAKLLIESGANVNARADSGTTPLILAADWGNVAMVQLLLKHGADVNAKSKKATPLTRAVLRGRLSVVKLLLERGADPDLAGEYGRPIDMIDSIRWDSQDQHHDMFMLIVNSGASVVPTNGMNPLRRALHRANLELLLLMIDKGAVVDAFVVETIGRRALRQVAEGLANRGVKIFTGEGVGSTLLHGAVCGHDAEFFEWTAANTPDVNVANPQGKTPLHYAARCGNVDYGRRLLAKGADVNRVDAHGDTAVEEARTRPFSRLLFDAGADPNHKDRSGRTPLMRAAHAGSAETVQLLLKFRADAGLKDRDGNTALHLAVTAAHMLDVEQHREERLETLRAILGAAGLRPNEMNARGETALNIATQYGLSEIAALLIAHGADPSIGPPAVPATAERKPSLQAK